MSKQLLIPVNSVEDADAAMARIGEVAETGDGVMVLVVSEELESEFTGMAPPPQATNPYPFQHGYGGPRTPNDVPTSVSGERLMELKGRELREALQPRITQLCDRGYEARVDTVFSDKPEDAIRGYASDHDAGEVYMTGTFYKALDTEDGALAKVLPGT